MSLSKIIEGIFGILFLISAIPLLLQLNSIANPPINTIALEEVKNCSEQLSICQQNYQELNNTVVTKSDLNKILEAIKRLDQNVINIYETNNNYINAYIYSTIQITISLTILISLGLFALIDLTLFNVELSKSLIKIIKDKFKKKSRKQSEGSL